MLDLLRAAPLIDGHNDLLWELRQGRDQADPTLMTDLPRMAAGGVGGQFWSVYVPSDLPADRAVTMTLEQIDALLDMVRHNPDRLELGRSADDVERIAAAGRVASMIGVEGGHSIGGSLGTLRVMAELGMGYLTLTHNDDTPWADSATGDQRCPRLRPVRRKSLTVRIGNKAWNRFSAHARLSMSRRSRRGASYASQSSPAGSSSGLWGRGSALGEQSGGEILLPPIVEEVCRQRIQ